MQGIFSTLVAGSFCWFVASSLWVYPHSLSYFNESIGGPLNGAEHLLGSNLDWGQDIHYLDSAISSKEVPRDDRLILVCVGETKLVRRNNERLVARAHRLVSKHDLWLSVGSQFLNGYLDHSKGRRPKDASYLDNQITSFLKLNRPAFVAGYTISVFRVKAG